MSINIQKRVSRMPVEVKTTIAEKREKTSLTPAGKTVVKSETSETTMADPEYKSGIQARPGFQRVSTTPSAASGKHNFLCSSCYRLMHLWIITL